MKGDFSNWRDERKQNFNGVLHQQGRVLLDADWNAQTAITNDWQDTAGQDIIGAGVAAVPADQPDGFKIIAAVKAPAPNGDKVQLRVAAGRVWADGLLTELFSEPVPDVVGGEVTRLATYLTPPVQSPSGVTSGIANGIRDAVILEVWREEINAFQDPELLIEPALGGPDTTERVHTSMAFRLMRLAPGDTCENIRTGLQDKFGEKGKLRATLQPATAVTGDCPTLAGGGYTGFEHQLYRVEIADVNSGPPQFKWSQFGGGLVGRGDLVTGSPNKIQITANLQAIASSGLSSFYLEALVDDKQLGRWRVNYGVRATLSNGDLTLESSAVFGTVGPAGATFFRLWNGIQPITGWVNQELPNQVGIFLDFEQVFTPGKHVPGDYWTFPVRAGEIPTPEPLVGNDAGGGLPPRGIHYHRVPLAVLAWNSTSTVSTPIEDCRHIFQPLTRLATCCSYRVGDGMDSWGDFQTIKDAIAALPAEGGEICVLPGRYNENVLIERKHNITIKGCGGRSRISPGTLTPTAPIFRVLESRDIKIESLAIAAHHDGVGVMLEGPDILGAEGGTLRGITLEKLSITAATRCAIETHIGFDITISGCDIEMSDEVSDAPGIFFAGDDSSIENNTIRVLSEEGKRLRPSSGGKTLDTNSFSPAIRGRGGLNIGGTSERVRVVNNLIQGGVGNGITLGTLAEQRAGGVLTVMYPGVATAGGATPIVSAGDLYEILIERNRIFNMGLNGIGAVGFVELAKVNDFVSVHGLVIIGNVLRGCMIRDVTISPALHSKIGYGGIALSHVEYLAIRDNTIEANGRNQLDPVCGIFILYGEGIEISRNWILNNGAKPATLEHPNPAQLAKLGARGGIYIVKCTTPVETIGLNPEFTARFGRLRMMVQNGMPAATVHDNKVSVPLGQALAMVALGAVSVLGNQFTSRGMVLDLNSPSFWASTVMIINLGTSRDLIIDLLTYKGLHAGQGYHYSTAPSGTPGTIVETQFGYLRSGNVLFSNNQCSLDLLEAGLSFALSSILIFSLDDVAFNNNECDCNLFDDFVLTDALLFGITIRANDNRFREGIFNAVLSAITMGLLNITTDNEATHCLVVEGWRKIRRHNLVLLSALTGESNLCRRFEGDDSDDCDGRRIIGTWKDRSFKADTIEPRS